VPWKADLAEKGHSDGKGICKDCYIDEGMAPKRKTHWQYLRSKKTDYLTPAKLTKPAEKNYPIFFWFSLAY